MRVFITYAATSFSLIILFSHFLLYRQKKQKLPGRSKNTMVESAALHCSLRGELAARLSSPRQEVPQLLSRFSNKPRTRGLQEDDYFTAYERRLKNLFQVEYYEVFNMRSSWEEIIAVVMKDAILFSQLSNVTSLSHRVA